MKRILVLASILIFSCSSDPQNCDILIENGIIYDGTGDKPYKGIVAISDDKIVYVGKNKNFVVRYRNDYRNRCNVSKSFRCNLDCI